MPEEKKVVWIDWALDEENKYKNDIKIYASQNPNFVPAQTVKPIITKEEKQIKERVAGKPVKPPNSAYSVFSRKLLQSDDIKSIGAKDRMNYISNRWKMCSDEEKRQYKERADHVSILKLTDSDTGNKKITTLLNYDVGFHHSCHFFLNETFLN